MLDIRALHSVSATTNLSCPPIVVYLRPPLPRLASASFVTQPLYSYPPMQCILCLLHELIMCNLEKVVVTQQNPHLLLMALVGLFVLVKLVDLGSW